MILDNHRITSYLRKMSLPLHAGSAIMQFVVQSSALEIVTESDINDLCVKHTAYNQYICYSTARDYDHPTY